MNSYPDAGGQPNTGNCSTATTPQVLSHTYDQADRITDTGYTYDLFGRTTAVPAADAGGTALTLGYYANDLVASQTSGSTTRSYALDPARRFRSWTDGSVTSTNHYATASTDSPSWIGVTGGAWTRNIPGIQGGLAAVQDSSGAVVLQLANLHGDIVATVADDVSVTSIANYAGSNEYGIPYFTSTAYARYGWLGGELRSRDSLGGLTLMGVRLYSPYSGRFLSTDPVFGGSANPYDYALQDPLNTVDLDGLFTTPAQIYSCATGLALTCTTSLRGTYPEDWSRWHNYRRILSTYYDSRVRIVRFYVHRYFPQLRKLQKIYYYYEEKQERKRWAWAPDKVDKNTTMRYLRFVAWWA